MTSTRTSTRSSTPSMMTSGGSSVKMSSVKISVLVPSRGRPESIRRLSEAFKETCELPDTRLHVIIDDDESFLAEYYTLCAENPDFVRLWTVPKGPPGIVHPVNYVSDEIFRPELGFSPDIIGFMGDDHLPRTKGWDSRVSEAFHQLQTGIVYGNDLLQGERLATAAFLSRDIVQTLGFVAPPVLRHLWVDNFWMDLGNGIERLKYLPEVVIEHLHYSIGKSETDETYLTVNSGELAHMDKLAYVKYRLLDLPRDIKHVKALL